MVEILRCDQCGEDIKSGVNHWQIEFQTIAPLLDKAYQYLIQHVHLGCISAWAEERQADFNSGYQ